MDVEVFWNYFCVTWYDKHAKQEHFFEIDAVNNISQIEEANTFYDEIKTVDEVLTFNGIHYDNPILNYIRLNGKALAKLPILEATRHIKKFSELIFQSERWWVLDQLKAYKYNQLWADIDLMLYWSKMLRKQKMISLKSLGAQLGYPVIQELPFDPQAYLTAEQIPELRHYNRVHDIGILRYLDTKTFRFYGKPTTFQQKIDLRYEAHEKFNAPEQALSWDDVKLGVDYLCRRYAEMNDIPFEELPTTSPWVEGTPIHLKDIIEPNVSFESKQLDNALKRLRKLTVYNTKSINEVVYFGGEIFDLKSGGLHNRAKPGVRKAPEGYVYLDWDVASEYPSLAAVLNVSPDHFPNIGLTFRDRKDYRVYLKSIGQGKSTEANYIKLALNGGVGYFNNQHSRYYWPPAFLRITLNGQLYLLMLCDMLAKIPGMMLDMANTDGVSFFAREDTLDQVKAVWDQWQEITGLVLEEEVLDTVWRNDINNYLCKFANGSIKQKGSYFITEPDLGNSHDCLIVAKAVNKYLLEGTPLRETIENPHNSILDYCAQPKCDKKTEVFYGKELLPQRFNRFFAATEGQFITRLREGKRSATPNFKSVKVQLLNTIEPQRMIADGYPIDFNYYLAQALRAMDKCIERPTLF